MAELPGLCEIKSQCRNLTTFPKVINSKFYEKCTWILPTIIVVLYFESIYIECFDK
jgi:hypothetical protein